MTEHTTRDRADVVRDIHTVAENMGARKVRVDRSQWEGPKGPWIEVGYGCGEIKVRTSVGSRLEYRADWDRVSMEDVIELIERLLDWNPEEGVQ